MVSPTVGLAAGIGAFLVVGFVVGKVAKLMLGVAVRIAVVVAGAAGIVWVVTRYLG